MDGTLAWEHLGAFGPLTAICIDEKKKSAAPDRKKGLLQQLESHDDLMSRQGQLWTTPTHGEERLTSQIYGARSHGYTDIIEKQTDSQRKTVSNPWTEYCLGMHMIVETPQRWYLSKLDQLQSVVKTWEFIKPEGRQVLMNDIHVEEPPPTALWGLERW